MSVEVFPFGLAAIVVVGGLLAVFAVWAWKRIADEKTRSQGVVAVALAVGIIVLGIFFTRASVDHGVSPRPLVGIEAQAFSPRTGVDHGTAVDSSIAIENGRLGIQVSDPSLAHYEASTGAQNLQTNTTGNVPPAASHVAAPVWGILVIGGGALFLIIIAKRSVAAAIAGLGILAGLLLMYALRFSPSPPTATSVSPVPEVMNPSAANQDTTANRTTPPVSDTASAEHDSTEGSVKAPQSPPDAAATVEAAERPATESSQPRPSWVEKPAQIEKETGEYKVAVTSGPYSTEYECDYQLDDKIREAVYQYADRHLGPRMKYFAYHRDYARQNLVEERYVETIQSQVLGRPMVQVHVLLKIDAADRRFFEARYREAVIDERVQIAGASAASIVGALALAYGALCYVGRRKQTASELASKAAQSTDIAGG